LAEDTQSSRPRLVTQHASSLDHTSLPSQRIACLPTSWSPSSYPELSRILDGPRADSPDGGEEQYSHRGRESGPAPSAEDLLFTRRMAQAGDLVGLVLRDHLIIGGTGRWVSLKDKRAF